LRGILFLLLFTAGFHHQLQAQSPNTQIWGEYMLNYPFANSYNVEVAATYSSMLNSPRWRSFDIQITPERALTQNIDLQAALTSSYTFQNESISTVEIREMIGTRIHFTPNRRTLLRLLVRFENRNFLNQETDLWTSSNRMRVRAESLFPINKPTMFAGDKLWYTLVDAEIFYVMDQDLRERFANRFRLRTGIGYRLNYTWRFEFVYTLQMSKNTIDAVPTQDNIFRFRVKHFINKGKPSTASGNGN
jgi:hypothetical protein